MIGPLRVSLIAFQMLCRCRHSIWNSLKFLLMGPISVILLIRARTGEAIARHRARRHAATAEREYAVAGGFVNFSWPRWDGLIWPTRG